MYRGALSSDLSLGGFNGRKGLNDSEVQRKVAILRAEGVMVDGLVGRVMGAGCVVSMSLDGALVDATELEDSWLAAPLA